MLGAGLRLYAIWFGLPYLRARPDEIDAVMHGQMVMRGDLNPHFFHWPSLTFYTFGAVFTAVSDVLGALSPGGVVSDAQYLVLARIVVALAGTATIAVLYDLARRVADAWTGIAAATFLAVAILHVRESHFAMTDVLMTLLAIASLALLARAVDVAEANVANTDPLRWFAASGLVGGLAASTKYNAAAVVAAMAAVQLVWLVRSPGKAATVAMWLPAPIFAAAFVFGFFAGTPYAAIDSRTFLADLRFDLGAPRRRARPRPRDRLVVSPHAVAPVRRRPDNVSGRGGGSDSAGEVLRNTRRGGRRVRGRVLRVVRQRPRGVLPVFAARCPDRLPLCGGGGPPRRKLGRVADTAVLRRGHRDVDRGRRGTAARQLRPVRRAAGQDGLAGLAADWLRQRVSPDETLYEEGGHYAAIDLGDTPVHRWSFNPADGSFGDTGGRTPDWLVLEGSPLSTWAGTSPEIRKLAAERYTLVRSVHAADDGWAVYDLADAFFLPVAGFRGVERPGPNILIYRRKDLPAVAQ